MKIFLNILNILCTKFVLFLLKDIKNYDVTHTEKTYLSLKSRNKSDIKKTSHNTSFNFCEEVYFVRRFLLTSEDTQSGEISCSMHSNKYWLKT